MDRWQGINHVVVAGLGVTGLSVVKHLINLRRNLDIKVIDTRQNPPGSDALPDSIALHKGDWNREWLQQADLIVLSPGIALATPEVQAAIQNGAQVVGDIELFAWAVKAPVLAITGSNGKSTVTDLTGEMAKAAGINVGVGGNIGVPALDLLDDSIELYVLELSSFQLETTNSLQLKAAAFLNLSEDHMDRYDGMPSYRDAKLRIFDNAEFIVVNRQDRETYPDQERQKMVSFGLDSEQFGLTSIDGVDYLSRYQQPILATSELNLVGKHNIANVLTVLALLECADVDYRPALERLKQYNGLTHRSQVVADKRGVKWVNDSKATNVASTIAALSGLEIDGKLHLLVGGDGKGADFSLLAEVLSDINLTLHCDGQDGDAFMPLHPSAVRWQTMQQAVQAIATELKPGDMVMLSPACASFDQYKNFMARGDAFTALANKYA